VEKCDWVTFPDLKTSKQQTSSSGDNSSGSVDPKKSPPIENSELVAELIQAKVNELENLHELMLDNDSFDSALLTVLAGEEDEKIRSVLLR